MGSASLGFRQVTINSILTDRFSAARAWKLHHWSLRFLCGQPVFMHEWRGTLVRILPGPLLTVLDATSVAPSAVGAAGTTCPQQGSMKCEICFEGVQIHSIFSFCVFGSSSVKIHVEHVHF